MFSLCVEGGCYLTCLSYHLFFPELSWIGVEHVATQQEAHVAITILLWGAFHVEL